MGPLYLAMYLFSKIPITTTTWSSSKTRSVFKLAQGKVDPFVHTGRRPRWITSIHTCSFQSCAPEKAGLKRCCQQGRHPPSSTRGKNSFQSNPRQACSRGAHCPCLGAGTGTASTEGVSTGAASTGAESAGAVSTGAMSTEAESTGAVSLGCVSMDAASALRVGHPEGPSTVCLWARDALCPL